MLALSTALITAALAIWGKILSDRWTLHQQKCGIAAALAGEIDGIMRSRTPTQLGEALLKLADFSHEERNKILQATSKVAGGSPVFEKIADKVGLLPVNEAADVCRIYGYIRGLNLNMDRFTSADFAKIDDRMQMAAIKAAVKNLQENYPLSQDLVARLTVIAKQEFWHWPVRIKLAAPGGRG
jgi:hypothetical protein